MVNGSDFTTTIVTINEDDSADDPHHLAMLVVNAVSSISGILGNCLVLAVLIKNKDHFQGISLFIAALAITDLTVCVVVQPVFICLLFKTLQDFDLKIFEDNVFAILIQMSLNLLFSIAIFRVTEICRPFFYRSFATRARMLAVILFVCAISTIQGVLFNRKLFRAAEPYFQYATIFAFLIIYAIIYRIAWKHRNVIACQARSLAFNHNIMTETRLAHLRTSTMTTGIITGAFVVCFLPFSVVNLIDHDMDDNDSRLLAQWATTIVCCNSSMNAYIYTLRSENFKKAASKTVRALNCFK